MPDTKGKSVAQVFCPLFGAVLVLAGLAGFIVDSSFDTVGSDSVRVDGEPLLGFEVNGWHNLAHIASGLVLLAGAPRASTAKIAALVFGVLYALIAVLGFTGNGDLLGLLPINDPDKVLHTVLAILGLVVGIASPKGDRDRDSGRHEPTGARAA